MKTTKRDLVRTAMYRLAETKELDWETVDLIKELGKAYNIDVYDKEGLVDGMVRAMKVVGVQIEDDYYIMKYFEMTDEYDEETGEYIYQRV